VTEATAATTVLFRAVSHAELADVMAYGRFRPGPNSYGLGKFFAESGPDAMQWGTVLEGSGNFRVLQVTLPRAVADRFMRFGWLDGIGAARFGGFDELDQATVEVWDGSP
jgi:hypothetical protein